MRNPTHHNVSLPPHDLPHPLRDRAFANDFVDFDWAALGPLWEDIPEATDTERERLAKALHEVFRFICLHGGGMNAIAQRAVALSWVVNPGLWDGASSEKVAGAVGCHPVRLREATADARRHFFGLEASR